MAELDLIIFDLDGVIVDTARYHFLSWQFIAKKLDIDFNEEHNEDLKGVSRKRSLDKILALGGQELGDEEKLELMEIKNNIYRNYISEMGREEILPGILNLLEEIKLSPIRCALGSASKNARMVLENLNLMHYFDCIVDGNDVEKAKPDPQVFTSSADFLETPYPNVTVIEDSISGIQAANSVNMFSIGVGSPSNLGEANWVIEGFSNIGLTKIDEKFKMHQSELIKINLNN